MTEREELLKRLERVKALAERGVGGEKENAEALLKRLMEKYDISDGYRRYLDTDLLHPISDAVGA